MLYLVGQRVLFRTPIEEKKEATILFRKIDFPEGYINTDYEKGGYDYLISINDSKEHVFCQGDDLEILL